MAEIFLFGDSITWGSWDPIHGGWAQQLCAEIDRIQLGSPEVWCPVYNLGIPGDTAAGIAVWSSWLSKPWRSFLYDGLHPNSEGHLCIFHEVRALVIDRFSVCAQN